MDVERILDKYLSSKDYLDSLALLEENESEEAVEANTDGSDLQPTKDAEQENSTNNNADESSNNEQDKEENKPDSSQVQLTTQELEEIRDNLVNLLNNKHLKIKSSDNKYIYDVVCNPGSDNNIKVLATGERKDNKLTPAKGFFTLVVKKGNTKKSKANIAKNAFLWTINKAGTREY